MIDPYQPALADFAFTEHEQEVINAALKKPKPWDHIPDSNEDMAALKSAKMRILDYNLSRHGRTCCYCRTNLYGAGPFMIDREHILPKSKAAYTQYSYTMWNLSVACKRCNIEFKGRCTGFVINATDPVQLQLSENYRLIHPNFDRWENHFTRLTVQVNAQTLVKIFSKPDCEKATYTRDFFKLHSLEVDSFDQGQGAEINVPLSLAVANLFKLAEQFHQ